jgi:hypothetical protein
LFASLIAHAEETGKWVIISDALCEKITASGKKIGYPGLTGGVTADPVSGEPFIVVCDNGIWKPAGDTFDRADGGKIGGRTETGFALDFDPNGKRLMCFMIYGPSAYTLDGGKTWHPSKLSHLDHGAVDWSDPEAKRMIAFKHESGGELAYTSDAAKSWKSLGKGFKQLGIFDGGVLMASKGEGILRSTDEGATWNKVSDLKPVGWAMRVHKGVGYWTTDNGVLVSRDKGQTWAQLGAPVQAYYGPYFGKDENQLIVVGKSGAHATADGGKSWKQVAPLPPGFTVGFTGPNFGWDPQKNILYASSMGRPTYKFILK